MKRDVERTKIAEYLCRTFAESLIRYTYHDGKIRARRQISWPGFRVKPCGQFGCMRN